MLASAATLAPSTSGTMEVAFAMVFIEGDGGCTDTCGVDAGVPVFMGTPNDDGRALAGKRVDLVARRRSGNKVGGRMYCSMVSRRNLWSQQDLKS